MLFSFLFCFTGDCDSLLLQDPVLQGALILAEPHLSAAIYLTFLKAVRDVLREPVSNSRKAPTLPAESPIVNYCFKLASVGVLARIGTRQAVLREVNEQTRPEGHVCSTVIANAMLDHLIWHMGPSRGPPAPDPLRLHLVRTDPVALKVCRR